MDWEKLWDIVRKTAAISNIGAFVLGIVAFLYTVLPKWFTPIPAIQTEAVMRDWLPSLIIGGCLVLAAIFNLLAFSVSRRKRKLQKQIAELTEQKTELEDKANLILPNSEEIQRLKFEIEGLNGELVNNARSAEKYIKELESETHQSRQENAALGREKALLHENYDRRDKEAFQLSTQLTEQTTKGVEFEKRYEGKRQQVNDLKAELTDAKRDAENSTKRANYETNQREEFIKLYHEAEYQLTVWKPIIDQAKGQAAKIDEWVRMKEAIPGTLLLAKSPRMVTLEIRIRNESLYPISICSKEIKGCLRFKAVPLREEIHTPPDEPSIEDLEPRGLALIKLQQPLRVFEAERIQESREGGDNDGLFWLGDLYIPISAKNTPISVGTKPLVAIPEYISLDVNTFSYNK